MTDIAMCLNDECPLAKNCYRHEAVPSEPWQSHADFRPNEDGECPNFLRILWEKADD